MNKFLKLCSIACILLTACNKQITDKPILQTAGETTALQSTNALAATATRATYFNNLFTRYNAGEWTGGDVAFSLLLPDGRSMWLWGDSFVDTVYADRHRPFDPFIHNSIVLTNPQGLFTTLYKGTVRKPKPFFNAQDPYFYWPNCAFVNKQKTKVYVMMVRVKATGEGGLFGFETVGNAVAVLSLPDLTLQRITVMPTSNKIDWSSAAFTEGNYVYIYGAEGTSTFPNTKYMHVMRTAAGNPFKKTEFYTGSGWSTDIAKSARLQSGVSEQYAVFKYNNKYYLLSQEGILLSSNIYMWDAASPVGPFTRKRKVYTTPETQGNIITYNATVHTEFTQNGNLLVGYCTNSLNGTDIWTNADNYRPYFVWLSGWQ